MLDVHDIHTYYGDSYVLQGVSLHVGEEADHADVLVRQPQLFNHLERLAARV